MEALYAYSDSDEEIERKEGGDSITVSTSIQEVSISVQESVGTSPSSAKTNEEVEEEKEEKRAQEVEERTLKEHEEETKQRRKRTVTLNHKLLPEAPLEPPDTALQLKLEKFHQLKANGRSINRNLQQSKAFQNPDILEKLITFCDIVEIGSNYPKDIYDPLSFHESDFYDNLALEQQAMYERREAEKQGRTQVEFVRGKSEQSQRAQEAPSSTAANSASSTEASTSSAAAEQPPSMDSKKKSSKSKWDIKEDEPKATAKPKAAPTVDTSQKASSSMSSSAYAEYVKLKRQAAADAKAEEDKRRKVS